MSGLIFAYEGYVHRGNLLTWHRFLRTTLSDVVTDAVDSYGIVEKLEVKPSELSLKTIVGEKMPEVVSDWEFETLENGRTLCRNKKTGAIKLR
jgi:hypothetical protein